MTGKYQHTVDPKGRLFVPSKLRDALGEAFYVTLGLDHCLSAYTQEDWDAIQEKYRSLPLSQQSRMRFFFANAAKCEPDKLKTGGHVYWPRQPCGDLGCRCLQASGK